MSSLLTVLCSVDARDKRDLDEKDIVIRLRKAGGADYNGGRG